MSWPGSAAWLNGRGDLVTGRDPAHLQAEVDRWIGNRKNPDRRVPGERGKLLHPQTYCLERGGSAPGARISGPRTVGRPLPARLPSIERSCRVRNRGWACGCVLWPFPSEPPSFLNEIADRDIAIELAALTEFAHLGDDVPDVGLLGSGLGHRPGDRPAVASDLDFLTTGHTVEALWQMRLGFVSADRFPEGSPMSQDWSDPTRPSQRRYPCKSSRDQ